jgi:hypothetical protein
MFRKQLLLAFLAFSAYTPLSAQFSKGMRMPGFTIGTAFFNSGTTEYTPISSNTTGYTSNVNKGGLSLAPSLGWFVREDWVVGGQLIAGYTNDNTVDDQNNVTFRKNVYKTFNAGLGVFTRKYFLTGKSLIPFVQLNAAGGSGSSKSNGFLYATNYKQTYTGRSSGDFFASGGLNAGVTKMLGDHIGLDLYAGYLYSYQKSTFKTLSERDVDFNGTIDERITEEITTKKTNHGFSLGAGLQIFLGKR